MLLDAFASFNKLPFLVTHEHIHAIAATTCMIFTTALIAKPGTGPVFVIKAVAVFTAAKGARLVLIGEL
jgi:hypothetical protein